jgi:hypothetical protein
VKALTERLGRQSEGVGSEARFGGADAEARRTYLMTRSSTTPLISASDSMSRNA